MITVRGVNVYPLNIEHALLSLPGIAPHYQLVVDRPGDMDELTGQREPADGADPAGLAATVTNALRDQLGVRVAVEVLEHGPVPRSEGKAVRVVHRRPQRGSGLAPRPRSIGVLIRPRPRTLENGPLGLCNPEGVWEAGGTSHTHSRRSRLKGAN